MVRPVLHRMPSRPPARLAGPDQGAVGARRCNAPLRTRFGQGSSLARSTSGGATGLKVPR
jgi:hypothetical protein